MELEAILNLLPLPYLVQDESHVGRKTENKRVMTAKGGKPVAKVEWLRTALIA